MIKELFNLPSRSLNTCRETRHLGAGEVEIPQQTSKEVEDSVRQKKG